MYGPLEIYFDKNKVVIMIKKISKEVANKISNMSFICAAFVVMIHIERSSDCYSVVWFANTISQVAVPFFFVASGCFLLNRYGERSWYLNSLKKRVLTLVVPYFALNILYFPIKYGVHYVGCRYFGSDHSDPIMDISLINFLRAISPIPAVGSPCVGPLWYIRALMWLVVFSPITAICMCRSRAVCILSLLVIALLWGAQIAGLPVTVPLGSPGLDCCYRCLFYFAVGMALRRWTTLEVSSRVGIFSLCTGIIFSILAIMNGGLLGEYLGVLSTALLLVGIWWAIPCSEWSPFFVKNTFVIFALHTIFMFVCLAALKAFKIVGLIDHGIGVWLLAICYLLICCAIGSFVRRYAPNVSKFCFGGR